MPKKKNKTINTTVINYEACWNGLKSYIKISMTMARAKNPDLKDVITPVMLQLEKQNSQEVPVH